MRVSLSAGLILVVVLGLVFVPKALQYGDVKVTVVLERVQDSPLVVRVSAVSARLSLDTYRAWVNETNATAAPLNFNINPLAANATWYGNVTFTDNDGDGALSVGDRFTIVRQPGDWVYDLSLFNSVRDKDAKAPCPCPVVIFRFP